MGQISEELEVSKRKIKELMDVRERKKRRPALDLSIVSKKKKVAVHFCNGLGNFVQLTPAMQALAKHFDAEIDLILDESWKDSRRESVQGFAERWPLISEVKNFQNGFRKDDYVQLFYTRHGEGCPAFDYFFENAGYEAAGIDWRAEKANEVDYYMNEVRRLGYRGKVPDLHCVDTPDVDISSFVDCLRGIDKQGTLRIGFCNGYFAGSQWQWERKGWPHFGELAGLLRRFLAPNRIRIHLLGRGKREEEWAESVMKENAGMEKENGVIGFTRYDIGQTIAVIRRLHLFVTTDTGLMHLADALKIPMVVLFGPTLVRKNGPYNGEHRMSRSPLRCAPCQHGPRFILCKEWRCMEELKPWMVMRTIRDYLHDLYKENRIELDDFRGALACAFSLAEE